ncbi:PREDICTED: ubiquitin carboxyl-terminal hydrolase 16-like, partial [Acropora digitifera]|uniref:ubiquitin carboxyl-terminal hydrolase 16-like n=1 Tax=Acropora digitifera TaxID=70779 RepID=UPI00077A453C
MKTCPHISRSVQLKSLQNKIPHTTLGQCVDCGELDSSSGLGVCICLCCAKQGCDRNSEEKHALSHNGSNPSHSIVVHLQNWVVWCYDCDDQVLVQAESTIHNCIKLILKAMNLSPPPELELVLVSNSNKLAEDITPQKDNFKNNGQIRGRIKGLTNLGNTCFFNAVIQNLCQTELLYVAAACAAKEGFSQNITPKSKDVPQLTVTIQETAGPVTNALCKLLHDFRGSSGGTLNPRQLFGEICKKATRFKGYRQQDSQELLRYLLDSIRNEEIK